MVDYVHFPFLAVVNQREMKMALLLAVINPQVGGVLLIGPRGTGKTTAVRGLVDLMPPIQRSTCPYGCEPEAAYARGLDAVCRECAEKLARGEPITAPDRMRLIELPLNARLEDVVGGINERVALEQQKIRLERGILSYADRNILYVDEINLLDDAIVNAILDAAAQGRYTVRRGPLSSTYHARFVLIGSMNPEEGVLRPQIMDRLGLRVIVNGLTNDKDRLEVYRRVRAFAEHPHDMLALYAEETAALTQEIADAKARLPEVVPTGPAERLALRLVRELQIASHRAEFVLLEAARAHAAADGRLKATVADVRAVALMALRQRRSEFMVRYFAQCAAEDEEIRTKIAAAS
ncbi:MAG: ATP-binding protein [Anaerolineae bacterium]|nr:ATP-binding protein [Anaerolineae bacterium]RLC63287.1 MAG: magnesium chelatase [Chloroflexota bacterium]